MRRKTVTIGIAYVCGLFLASLLSVRVGCYAMMLAAAASAVLAFRFDYRICLMVSVAFVVGMGNYIWHTVTVYDRLVAFDGQEVVFSGCVRDISYTGADRYSVTLRGELDGVKTDIEFLTGDISADYGDNVTLRAVLTAVSDSLEYRAESYQKPKNLFLSGGYAKVLSVEDGGFSIRSAVLNYRDYLFDLILETLPGREGGFIAAMLCGDKSQLDSRTKTALYRCGVGHIFSVSGMHLMLISSAVMFVLKRLRLGVILRFALGEGVMLLFVVFAGGSTSVIRAAVMMTLLNSSLIMRRSYDCLSSILLSIMLITAVNPYAVRSVSLIMSAGGAFAMGVAAPKAMRLVKSGTRFSAVKKALVAAAVVSVIMMPASLCFFDEISIISPIANALLIPLFTVTLTLAAAVALTGGLGFFAMPLLIIAGLAAKLLLFVGDVFAQIPFAYVPTGYKSVRAAAIICWLAALSVMVCRKRFDVYSAAAAAMSLICLLSASITNSALLADTVRIYILSDNKSQTAAVINGSECVIVNMSGNGGLSGAVKRLCDCKGATEAVAFYDLTDSRSAVAAVGDRFDLQGAKVNSPLRGFADFEPYGSFVEMRFGGRMFCISSDGSTAVGELCIGGETVYTAGNGKIWILPGDCTEIIITEDGFDIRRLDYGFAE